MKKAICIIILLITVLTSTVTVFLHEGDAISSKASWIILGICYIVFFPTFATLIKIDNEKRMNDGNRITRRSK